MIAQGESHTILLELINRIYDASGRRELLELIYRTLKGPLHLSPATAMIPIDNKSGRWQLEGHILLPGPSKWIEEWLIFYSKLDPVSHIVLESASHKALRITDKISSKQHFESPFYREFLCSIPATWILALPLSFFGEKLGMIWLTREELDHDFSDSDLEIGTTVAHHAGIAFKMQDWRNSPPLDLNPGILVLDGSGNLIYQNDVTQSIFEQNGAEWLLKGVVSSETRIIQTNLGTFRAKHFPLRKATDSAHPHPLSEERGKVVILEPYPSKVLLCQKMKELDLSKRQSQIVLEIMRGHTNKEIAEKLKITLQTVKDHLHCIFGHLNVRNRSELIIRVMGDLPFSDNT